MLLRGSFEKKGETSVMFAEEFPSHGNDRKRNGGLRRL